MRALPSTLTTAQQATSVKSLVKLVLTHGSTTYTYTKTRILDIKETGDGPLQSLEIVLNNSDGTLTDLDFKGYEGVLSNGVITSIGEEYSACAPMWVLAQEFNSDPDKLECTLTLVGICNLMSTDEASEVYQPDSDDTKSVKTLVDSIIEATITCFDHCTAYEAVWEAGYDTLADTYKPKDAFRIYVGNNRLSVINRLLDYTLNVAVVKADGKIHIFKPVTSGSTYDYEYSLESGHPFFSKALRNRLVTPNYIKVQSKPDDSPSYSGTATDTTSHDLLPKAHYVSTRLENNDQAAAIAAAILAKVQMWCEAGAANVPLNVGTEVFDYVKVTDEREDDNRIGNIGRYVRHYNVRKNEWRMTFAFGNWQNVRKVLAGLNITGDDIENYFSRLQVGDLYVENILVDNVDFVWIDPEGNIDLDKIGDNLDNLPDGEVYYRTQQLHLDASGVYVQENTLYTLRVPDVGDDNLWKSTSAPSTPSTGDYWIDLNYTPNKVKKWTGSAWEEVTGSDLVDLNRGVIVLRLKGAALTAAGLVVLDQVQVGTYDLVLATDIGAGHILLSKTTKDGEWYDESGVAIDATKGIAIYGGSGLSGLRTYPTATDYANDTNVQCYVGTDGKIYAGGGNVRLDSVAAHFYGEANARFYYGDSNFGRIGTNADAFVIASPEGSLTNVYLYSDKAIWLWPTDGDMILYGGDFRPNSDNTRNIGSSSKQFHGGYYKSRLKIPVGTDLYD